METQDAANPGLVRGAEAKDVTMDWEHLQLGGEGGNTAAAIESTLDLNPILDLLWIQKLRVSIDTILFISDQVRFASYGLGLAI